MTTVTDDRIRNLEALAAAVIADRAADAPRLAFAAAVELPGFPAGRQWAEFIRLGVDLGERAGAPFPRRYLDLIILHSRRWIEAIGVDGYRGDYQGGSVRFVWGRGFAYGVASVDVAWWAENADRLTRNHPIEAVQFRWGSWILTPGRESDISPLLFTMNLAPLCRTAEELARVRADWRRQETPTGRLGVLRELLRSRWPGVCFVAHVADQPAGKDLVVIYDPTAAAAPLATVGYSTLPR